MADSSFGPVVTTAWLADHLGDPGLRVVDATWYLPTLQRDARARVPAGAHSRRRLLRHRRDRRPAAGAAPHAAGRGRPSPRRRALWASGTTTGSSSTRGSTCPPRRECGGPFASSATTGWPSSTAASRAGGTRADPSRRESRARRAATSPRAFRPELVTRPRRRAPQPGHAARAGRGRPIGRPVRGRPSRSRAPASAGGTSPGA